MSDTNFFIRSGSNIGIDIDFVVFSDLLFELNEFREVATSVDSQEGSEVLHEHLSLSQESSFRIVVGKLFSQEFNERKSDLVVLDRFNVLVVLSATFSEDINDLVLIFLDSLDEPSDILNSVVEFSSVTSKNVIKTGAFSLLVVELVLNSIDVSLEDGFVNCPVGFKIIKVLLGFISQILENIGSSVNSERSWRAFITIIVSGISCVRGGEQQAAKSKSK